MASYDDTAKRYTDIVLGRTNLDPLRNDRMPVRGSGSTAKVYSYGTHFELARLVTPRKGSPFFLLNGDTYSNTTARHQRIIRTAVEATGVPSVIVPHSALTRAGIDPDSIRPVAIDPERWETTTHTATVPGLVELGKRAAEGSFGWNRSTDYPHAVNRGAYALGISRDLNIDGTRYSVQAHKRGYDYGPVESDCGACDGTGRIDGTPCGNPQCVSGRVTNYGGFVDYDPPRVTYYRNGGSLKHAGGDKFTYETHRHFLGASVFRATVVRERERACPEHGTSGDPWCNVCGSHRDGSGVIRDTVKRLAYFVSAFDDQEARPLYFLAELPADAKPASVAEALSMLAPAEVHLARAEGRNVIRQGDIFAVPCTADDGPPPIAAKYAERHASIPLDGTGRHIATELVICADGGTERVYARGVIRHTGGDHRRVKLGETWHRIYRNRVPMQTDAWTRPTRTLGGTTVPELVTRRSPRAWTIAGRVD